LIASSNVQGECKNLPSETFLKKAGGPLLEELLPHQCVILSPLNSPISTTNAYVVDNIYMRHPAGKDYGGLVASSEGTASEGTASEGTAFFLINSTFDGATGDGETQSMAFHSTSVYAEGELYYASCMPMHA
jgi:hypothetical protein